MVTSSFPAPRRASRTRLILILTLLAALGLWFIDQSVLRYAHFDSGSYGDFWPRRYGLLLHIAGGLTALSVGIAQIWLGLTGRTRQLHRTLGRVYASGVLIGSAGAYYLALTIAPTLKVYAVGLFLLATAWVLTTGMAVLSIARRAHEQHREWMLRSYTVTFAFVTFRLLSPLIAKWHLATPDEADAIMAWGCWSVPLLLAEPLLQLRRMRTH